MMPWSVEERKVRTYASVRASVNGSVSGDAHMTRNPHVHTYARVYVRVHVTMTSVENNWACAVYVLVAAGWSTSCAIEKRHVAREQQIRLTARDLESHVHVHYQQR